MSTTAVTARAARAGAQRLDVRGAVEVAISPRAETLIQGLRVEAVVEPVGDFHRPANELGKRGAGALREQLEAWVLLVRDCDLSAVSHSVDVKLH